MTSLRLRQLVIAAQDMDTAASLKTVLGLGEGFPDPGVAEFGLVNSVFAIGDQFLEVVAPTTPDAPAARFMARTGEGGYMAIFQTDDLESARARVDGAGIRRVWNIDLEDIAASHLHPADTGAAIVSLDQPVEPAEWRWAGPDWRLRSIKGVLKGATVESGDPAGLAAKWASALGRAASREGAGASILLDGGRLDFMPGPADRLSAFSIALEDPDAAIARARRMKLETDDHRVALAGIRLDLSPLDG